MTKIKGGCIGLGPRGSHLMEILFANPNIIPCAVCDLDEAKLEKARKLIEEQTGVKDVKYCTSVEEFLKTDVEAVVVATHIDTHAEISAQALNAGKHVICEIPNIANFEQAKILSKAVKGNPKSKFMVGENCCYWGFINTWKKMYEDGLIGTALFCEADYLHMSKSMTDPGQPKTWRSYLSAVTYMTHDIGPLLYILDDTCDEIWGFTPDINPIEDEHPGPPNGAAMIKTKKGALIKIFIGFGIQKREQCHNYVIYGSKGSLENQRTGPFAARQTYADLSSIPNTESVLTIPAKISYPGVNTGGHGGADGRMMEDFVKCIINDTKPPLDLEFGLNIAIPGILADISAKEGGKAMKMPSIEEFLK